MLTLKKSNLTIGLDISDSVIRAVELKKTREKIRINCLSKYRLKPGIVEGGEIKNKEEMIKAISLLLSKPKFGSFSSSMVVACLPDSKTFIKLIEVEKTINDLKQIIGAEIEKHIPLALNNIYYDWQIISETPASYKILIGAAPKNIVEQYIDTLSSAKLSVIALEIESVSLVRALLKEESPKHEKTADKSSCVIDIGAKRTSLTIYSKNTIVTSVSLPISSDESTELIAKSLEIDKDKAEQAKFICGLDKTQAHGIVSEILSDMIKVLIDKIEMSIDFFSKHYPEAGAVNDIIICGGGSNIKDLDKFLFEKLKIPVSFGNPLLNLNEDPAALEKNLIKDNQDKENSGFGLANYIASYASAIGLGLRSIFIDKA